MKFSITIPAYKRKYLKEAMASVLAQTYQDYELIIVDDCSPEDLRSVVGQFKDSRIRYYRNDKNCGAENVVDNWNICLGYCTGEWVICMGDDDLLMPDCLEEYAKSIIVHPELDVFHTRVRQIDEEGNLIRLCQDRPEISSAYGNIIHYLEGRHQYIVDFCFNVDRLRREGGYYKVPYAWGSDNLTAFIVGTPKGVYNIQKPTCCYRVNRYSIGRSGGDRIKLKAILMAEKWLRKYVSDQTPRNEFDKDELETILYLIPDYLRNFQCFHISHDIMANRSAIFYWLRECRQYRVSRCQVLKLAIKVFFKKKATAYELLKSKSECNYTRI